MAKHAPNDGGFSRAGGLSAFYGTVLVLLGLVIPMTEALQNQWLTNDFVALFVTYLYTGAAAFISYLLVQEAILKKQYLKQLEEENDGSESEESSVDEYCPSVNYTPSKNGLDTINKNGIDSPLDQTTLNIAKESPNSSDAETSSTLSNSPPRPKDVAVPEDTEAYKKTPNNVNKLTRVTFLTVPDEAPSSPLFSRRRCNGTGTKLDPECQIKPENSDVDDDESNSDSETSSALDLPTSPTTNLPRRRSGTVSFMTPPSYNRSISQNSTSSRLSVRRFSSLRPRSGTVDQAPDDVYNYIASHMGTATLVNEGTSTFLKGGSLIFAMANVVYVALRIEGDHKRMSECDVRVIVYPHYMHLVFIILQTFFLLKECNFVLRQKKAIASFGLAHLVATNLCVWLRFLMIEVVESLEHRHHAAQAAHSSDVSSHHKRGVDSYDSHHNYSDYHVADYNATIPKPCQIQPISATAGPYLFPFVLEYSLVAMSACTFLFTSINIRVSKEMYRKVLKVLARRKSLPGGSSGGVPRHHHPAEDEEEAEEEEENHGPCYKSHTGLFLGVLVLSGTVISMVMFFYFNEEHDYNKANICYTVSESMLLIFLLIATVLAFLQISQFVVDLNQSNSFDHILLLLSVSLYVILELFQLFSAIAHFHNPDYPNDAVSVMTFLVCVLALIQGAGQAVFLLDGMQRVAVLGHHKRNKHGRGVITFLIVANVAAWVFKSFQEKASDSESEYDYYGDVAWTIIRSVALPLVLFFRFHSSICLAHMWHHCYKSKVDDIMETQILI